MFNRNKQNKSAEMQRLENTEVQSKKADKSLVRPPLWKSALLLLLAISLMAAAIFARMMTSSDEEKLAKLETKIANSVEQKNNKQNYRDIQTIESIGMFERQVNKVRFDDIILEKRSEHAEFKDAEYVMARKASWTVEVMDVAEEDVILDYLATAEKRDQYAYFRYVAPDKTKRYKLIFDDFNDDEGAKAAIESNVFTLPSSVKPESKPFKDYVGKVDSYHLQRNVKDFKRSASREVILRKVRAPVYTASSDSVPVMRHSTTKSRRNASNRLSSNVNNAFGSQPKRQGRVVQPDIAKNSQPNSSNHVIIEDRSLSQSAEVTKPANKPAVEVPVQSNTESSPPEVKAPAKQSDNLSELIERIDE